MTLHCVCAHVWREVLGSEPQMGIALSKQTLCAILTASLGGWIALMKTARCLSDYVRILETLFAHAVFTFCKKGCPAVLAICVQTYFMRKNKSKLRR